MRYCHDDSHHFSGIIISMLKWKNRDLKGTYAGQKENIHVVLVCGKKKKKKI